MRRTLLIVFAALVAAGFGYYAGMFVLLTLTGLSTPSWAPISAVAGAGVLSGLAAGLLADVSVRTAIATSLVGGALGAGLGWAVGELRDSFEWAIVTSVGLAVLLAIAVRTMAKTDRETAS